MPGFPQNGFGGGFQNEAQMGYNGFGWRQEYSQGTGPEYEAQELWTAEADEEFAQVHVFGPQGEQVPGAVTTFQQAQGMFPDILVHKLIEAGFTAPTPIQAHTWAIGVAGRDLIGIAKTGSGKTLAFLMPGFLKITQTRSRPSGSREREREREETCRKASACSELRVTFRLPQLCVLAPTRELACQIESEADRFGRAAGIRTACCASAETPHSCRACEVRQCVC